LRGREIGVPISAGVAGSNVGLGVDVGVGVWVGRGVEVGVCVDVSVKLAVGVRGGVVVAWRVSCGVTGVSDGTSVIDVSASLQAVSTNIANTIIA
jgi:hypothetical protein